MGFALLILDISIRILCYMFYILNYLNLNKGILN